MESPYMESPLSTQFKSPSPHPSLNGNISAYAKLNFASFSFYIQTLEIVLGRSGQKKDMVDVGLGHKKAISKQHARLFFNFASRCFELDILGRNGAFVGGKFVEQSSTVRLDNETVVQIGGVEFVFQLPPGASPPPPIDDSDEKPPYSYTQLITLALRTAPKLTLNEVYNVIQEQHAYYRKCKDGWQSSVRHNLSLSKQFRKIPREEHEKGKGCFWTIDENYVPPPSKQSQKQKHEKKPTNNESPNEKSTTNNALKTSPSKLNNVKEEKSLNPMEQILSALKGKAPPGMNEKTLAALKLLKNDVASRCAGASDQVIANAVALALAQQVKKLEEQGKGDKLKRKISELS